MDRFGAEGYLSVFSPIVRAEEATRFVRRQVDNQRIGWRSGYDRHADPGWDALAGLLSTPTLPAPMTPSTATATGL